MVTPGNRNSQNLPYRFNRYASPFLRFITNAWVVLAGIAFIAPLFVISK